MEKKRGFTYLEMIAALLILGIISTVAFKISGGVLSMTKHTQISQMATARNIAIVEEIQQQLDIGAYPIQEERQESYDTENVLLTSKISIQEDTALSGRSIYAVEVQTWVGGKKYEKVTLRALLTKRTGKVYQVG